MRIGVIGPGAVGLLFAYYLRKEAECVTVYTRTEVHAKQLRLEGITCTLNGRTETVYPHAEVLAEAPLQDDYLFIAVKQYDIEPVLHYVQRTRAACIFLQNGMSHISILQHMQDQPVAVGIVEHGAKKEGRASVVHTGVGTTRLGIVQGTDQMFAPLSSLFSPSFSLSMEKDWMKILVDKLIVNVCINPLTALYGVRNGELASNDNFRVAMRLVFQEAVSIVGVEMQEERWQRVLAVCENTAQNRSSMLTDVSLQRKTEIDAIAGYLINRAKEQRMPAPLLSFLYTSIKGMER